MRQPLKQVGALVVCAVLGQIVVSGRTQAEDDQTGIAYLTEARYKEAISCGRSGPACAVARYQLCPNEIKQYSAWIATPFSRVANSVFERVSRRQRARPMEQGSANAWGLGIYASPSDNYASADAIKRVILRRSGREIEPTTTTVAPVIVESGDQSKQLARGYFAFPMDALSPGADVTVVLTGSQSAVSCTLTSERLMTLQ